MKPRILVVEDDERIAATVRRALLYEGYDVDLARDGAEALVEARRLDPDVILLDLMLPEIDGLEVCRRIRKSSDVPILMLTARDGVADRVQGLDSGADDYLVKPFAHEELLARVRSLLRRRHPQGREVLTVGALSADVDAMEVTVDGEPVATTALEFRLLEFFMRNRRIVLSRSRILEEVWGLESDTTSNIVDVYVRYLRQKLEANDWPRMIHTVRGAGYMLKDGE